MIRRTALRSVQAFSVITVLAVLSLASAVSAEAAAVVERVSDSHTETFTGLPEFCLPQDQLGTFTVTETSTGQIVQTASDVFIFNGVDVFDSHIDFPDGSYVQSGLNRDLISFVLNPPLTIFNRVTQDLRTIYNAQGQPIGSLAVHGVFHVTYTDLNSNGQPDEGEVTAQVDQFHFRCT